jgi:hypothetical protein
MATSHTKNKQSHNKYIFIIVRDYWPIWISQTQQMTTFGTSHQKDNEQQAQRVQNERLHEVWSVLQILTRNSRMTQRPASLMTDKAIWASHTHTVTGSQKRKLHNPKCFVWCICRTSQFALHFL